MVTLSFKASTEAILDFLLDSSCVHISLWPRVCFGTSTSARPSYDMPRGLAITRELDCVRANLNSDIACHGMSMLRSKPCGT